MLAELPYDREPISGYLHHFYGGRLPLHGLVGETYRLERCGRCGLVYQRWVPDDAMLQVLYGRNGVAVSDGTTRTLGERVVYSHQVECLVRHLRRPPVEVDVLDFGAGSGTWLNMARALGCRTTGAELDATGAERLRSLGHECVRPDQLPEQEFDYVNAEQVVEHLIDPAAAITAISASLRPGGILRIAVPDAAGIEDRLLIGDWAAPKGSHDSLNAIAPLEHVNCFAGDSLSRLAAMGGLEPFAYSRRVLLHPTARIRFALGAFRRRRREAGSVRLFRRPPTSG